MFFLGYFFAGNQILVHYVGEHFDVSDMQFSLIVGAMYTGSLIMVLLIGEISEHITKRIGVVIVATCYGLGSLFVVLAGNIGFLTAAFVLFGSGAGGMEAMLFSLIGDYNGTKNTPKIMNISQASFSLGAVIGPILIFKLLSYFSYKYMYFVVFIFMVVLSVIFYFSKDIDQFDLKSKERKKGLVVSKILKTPLMLLFMVTLMISIGCESSITYWLESYFGLVGFAGLGALGLSIYWIASIPGRLIASVAKDQGNYLSFCYVVFSFGLLIFVFVPNPVVKIIGVAIIGMAFAPVYPSLSSMGAGLFPYNSSVAFSLMVFSSGLGGALAQPVIGAISTNSSITTVYISIAIISLVLALVVKKGATLSKNYSRST